MFWLEDFFLRLGSIFCKLSLVFTIEGIIFLNTTFELACETSVFEQKANI